MIMTATIDSASTTGERKKHWSRLLVSLSLFSFNCVLGVNQTGSIIIIHLAACTFICQSSIRLVFYKVTLLYFIFSSCSQVLALGDYCRSQPYPSFFSSMPSYINYPQISPYQHMIFQCLYGSTPFLILIIIEKESFNNAIDFLSMFPRYFSCIRFT